MIPPNHALLYAVRPRTWELLSQHWFPVSNDDWRKELPPGCPERVITAQLKKALKGRGRQACS